MPSKDYLMLRSAQRARLEARTASLQLIFWCVNQFPDSLLRRCDGIFEVSIGTPSPDESCEWVETLEAAGLADLSTDILDETGEFIHARAYPAGSYDERTPLM